ncbi:mitochondrial inner membrane protease subunit 2 isoform X2 [Tetranychus urticae]|uniref:mitochondrial inner membrane protease subunit 2 isoform X2 n=1 Tax=Tetranychus urticae TaxID=32264 RepID=UPI00077BDF66|nr:mitochondrial inner membrane protease subunit 2 isoform X2 [Tetranychus urticae]
MESIKYLAKNLSFIIPIGLTMTDRVVTIAQVDGESMQPSFNPKDKVTNDIVLINRWSARNFHFKPGDIVEIKPRNLYEDDIIQIPSGHCWIEGDNSQRSNDSNHFGPVPIGLAKGTVSYIIWPPSRWSSVDNSLTVDKIKRRSTDGLII